MEPWPAVFLWDGRERSRVGRPPVSEELALRVLDEGEPEAPGALGVARLEE